MSRHVSPPAIRSAALMQRLGFRTPLFAVSLQHLQHLRGGRTQGRQMLSTAAQSNLAAGDDAHQGDVLYCSDQHVFTVLPAPFRRITRPCLFWRHTRLGLRLTLTPRGPQSTGATLTRLPSRRGRRTWSRCCACCKRREWLEGPEWPGPSKKTTDARNAPMPEKRKVEADQEEELEEEGRRKEAGRRA